MTTDLVEWLRLQLLTDEQIANEGIHTSLCINDVRFPEECTCGCHARVLREVEAKRLLLMTCHIWDKRTPTPVGYPERARQIKLEVELAEEKAAEVVLRLLALPYSDRPGYREEEWKPAAWPTAFGES